MPDRNAYNFSQPSPGNKPGFHAFQGKDELFYFHFNDKRGQAILYSQGYPSARKRSHVLSSARYQLNHTPSFQRLKEDKFFFFVLLSSKEEEVARSRPYKSGRERDATLKELKVDVPKRNKAPVDKDGGKEMQSIPHEAKNGDLEKPPNPEEAKMRLRHRFTLTFRRPGEDEPFRAEMEYPLTREKATFEGLNLEAVQQFIGRYVPEVVTRPSGKKEPQVTPPVKAEKTETPKEEKARAVPLKEEMHQLETVPQPEEKTPPPPAVTPEPVPLELHIFEKGHPTGQIYKRGAKGFEVQCQLQKEVLSESAEAPSYHAQVGARPLAGGGKELIIGRLRGVLPANGLLRIPILPNALQSGLYRLNARISLGEGQNPGGQHTLLELEENQVMQIY